MTTSPFLCFVKFVLYECEKFNIAFIFLTLRAARHLSVSRSQRRAPHKWRGNSKVGLMQARMRVIIKFRVHARNQRFCSGAQSVNGLLFKRKPLYCALFLRNGMFSRLSLCF